MLLAFKISDFAALIKYYSTTPERLLALLLALSENTQHSEFVLNEVERAKSYGKMVFTIRFEDVPLPRSMELILSSNHWVDAWEMDYPERIEQIVDGLKNKQPLSFEPVTTSPLTKLARVAKKNVFGIAILLLLLGIIAFFISMQTHLQMPDFYTSLTEVKSNDLSVTVNESFPGNGKLYLHFQPVATELYGATEILASQYQMQADFDNGISLTQVASLANIRFELPAMKSLPNSVTLTVTAFNSEQSVSLTFDLPQLAAIIGAEEQVAMSKAAQRIKQQLANTGNHCFAKDGFITYIQGCKFGSMATPIKYSQLQQVVSYISLGESASKLSHKLVLGDENSWSSDGFGLSLVNDTLEIIVPMCRAEMFMQIGFTDGSTSAVSPVKTVDMAQGNSVILLEPRQAGAPDLLLSFYSNLNQASLIVPHVDADADVQYSFYASVNDALQANGHMRAKTGLALNNVTSVGTIGLVVVHNGQSSCYEYINPIANAVADLELENAKNQVKTMFGCGQTHCSFGWLNSTQVDIDQRC